MRNSIVVGAVCLFVGLVIGLMLGKALTPQTQAAPTDVAKGDNSPRREVRENEHTVKPAEPAKTETPNKPAPAEEPAARTGRISVTVEWDDGTPAAGVKLRAFPIMRENGSYTEQETWGVERRIQATTDSIRKRYAGMAEAESAADGTMALAVDEALKYSIVSADTTIAITAKERSPLYQVSPGDSLLLVAMKLVPLSIEIVFDNGAVATTCGIAAMRTSAAAWSGNLRWTPETTTLLAPRGNLSLRATLSDDPLVTGTANVTIKPDDSAPKARIELKRPLGLYIKVVEPAPYYANMRYYVLLQEKIPTDQTFYAGQVPRLGIFGRQGADKRHFFKDTSKGDWVFLALKDESDIVVRQPLKLEGGTEERTIELPALKREEHVVVRVLAPDGSPVSQARVSISIVFSKMSFGDIVTVMEAGNGEYWVARPERLLATWSRFVDPAEASLSIRASHERYGHVFGEVAYNFSGVAELKFGGMAELKVKLLNLPKERRAEFILSVVPEGDNFNRSRRFSQFLPPSPAAYRNGEPYQPPEELAEVTTFPRLPPGKAKLVLSHKFGAESYSILTLLIQDIVIRESGSEETLTVPALYDLVVTPEPGVNYRYMSVAIPEEYGAQMAKQSDGSYILRQLPAGEYLVTAGTVGGMYVSVPADGPIAFRASPANAYRVTGYDGAGAYYRSGLRTGDLIVAMNGERATSYETLRSLREKSAEAATLRLEIVREGRNLEITLTGDDWRKAWKESTGLGYTVAK